MKFIDNQKLENAQNQKFNLKIEKYLGKAFKIYGKHWEQFALFTLVSGLLLTLSAITIVGPYIIYYPLQMGYCNVVNKIENEEQFTFKDFFEGFSKWTSFLSFIVIVLAISIIIVTPYILSLNSLGVFSDGGMVQNGSLGIFTILTFLICLICVLIFTVITFLPPYLIYFGENISGIESIKISLKIAEKNFFNLLLYIILFGIIYQFGFYICLIGAFVTVPVANIMSYLFVKDLLLESDRELYPVGESEEKQ